MLNKIERRLGSSYCSTAVFKPQNLPSINNKVLGVSSTLQQPSQSSWSLQHRLTKTKQSCWDAREIVTFTSFLTFRSVKVSSRCCLTISLVSTFLFTKQVGTIKQNCTSSRAVIYKEQFQNICKCNTCLLFNQKYYSGITTSGLWLGQSGLWFDEISFLVFINCRSWRKIIFSKPLLSTFILCTRNVSR